MTSPVRIALVLGLLSAIGPISVDMYLPALPTIAADLGTDVGAVQISVVVMFLALAVGQPVYGPLVDMLGRKRPLIAGLAVFCVAGIACAFVGSVEALAALRFVAGLGICAVPVASMAMVRDLHTGAAAARLIAIIVLLLGISPVVAPLAGSAVIQVAPWRAVFFIFAAAGALGIVLTVLALPETLPAERRTSRGLGAAFRSYGGLFRDRRFVALSLITGLTQAAFFSYIPASAFFFIGVYGLEPWQYSIAFATNAGGLVLLMQFNATMISRFGPVRLVVAAAAVNAVALTALVLATLAGAAPLWLAMALLFISCGCFAFVMTPGWVLAVDGEGARAGTASAVLGTVQFGLSSAAGILVSLAFDGTARPMTIAMAVAALAALALSLATFRPGRTVPAALG
jgi:DHA1 family bicyclomycin/chloramphenicol resistance-like MFS transporter